MNRYMEDVGKHSLRLRSFERRCSVVSNHMQSELGNIKLNSLRLDQVHSLYTKKLNEGLSKRTIQHIHVVLHKALDRALKWGLVVRNVTDLVEKPRPKRKEFTTWSADEVNRFLEVIADHLWYPIYPLAIYAGMRQGEILGLHRAGVLYLFA